MDITKRSEVLLKGLLLHQTAGAGNSIDFEVSQAIGIYCELHNITDLHQFVNELNEIKMSVWGNSYRTFKEQELLQDAYELRLNKFLEERK